jgi:CubicO group peptidase (beta-lactamase class C family)
VIWTSPVNVAVNGNFLQKTSGCDGCQDAGAVSTHRLTDGSGYLEFTVSETNLVRYVGLTHHHGTGTTAAEIPFAIKLVSGYAEARENDQYRNDIDVATGDVLRIAVDSGVVKYYKNGFLFSTSNTPALYPLRVDTAFISSGATLSNARVAGFSGSFNNSSFIPLNGTADPNFAHIGRYIAGFMTNRSLITAATLQIRKTNGEVLLHQGYGWMRDLRREPVPPDAMMRIYGITKSFTHLAINQLAASGRISKNARAFCLHNEIPSGTGCLLRITPAGNDGMPDPDADEITVQHLLDHKAGWDEGTPDANGVREPGASSVMIAGMLNVPSPPAIEQLIAYQLDQALDYRPGTSSVYSNFGYTVLGHIVEQYSGMEFMDYMHEHITDGLGIPRRDIELAQELVALRNPREPSRYISTDGRMVQNLFNPPGGFVQRPDGGLLFQHTPGPMGMISSTDALLDFMRAYWLILPDPRNPDDGAVWAFGDFADGGTSFGAQGAPLPGYGTQADFVLITNYVDPKSLNEEVWDQIRNTLIRDVVTGDNAGAAGSEQFFTLYVPENSGNVQFRTLGGSGDVALYARFDSRPTATIYDCESALGGTGQLCTIANPAAGTYYVRLVGTYSGVSITGSYD